MVYDAVVILGGASAAALAQSGLAIHFVNEAYRHGKPIAALGDGLQLLEACSLTDATAADGVIVGEAPGVMTEFIEAMLQHRFPNRAIEGVPA